MTADTQAPTPVPVYAAPLAGEAGAVPIGYLSRRAIAGFNPDGSEIIDAMIYPNGTLRPDEGIAIYATAPKAETKTASERERLVEENRCLREENARLRRAEYFWDYNDPETVYGDWADALYEPPLGEVVHLLCGATLPPIWVTTRVLTVDDDGDADETERVSFDNEQEATACWDASLAAARAARAALYALSTETGHD